ncbi:MAG: phosphodiesterase, partial [Chloroflexota bacterium]|nr:phosphodiesterase [Chloroflexota bacterium]
VQNANLTDLAPTILHLMGEPVSAHMDGRVLSEALRDDFQPLLRPPGVAGAALDLNSNLGDGLSADEQKVLAERLRSLGYVA